MFVCSAVPGGQRVTHDPTSENAHSPNFIMLFDFIASQMSLNWKDKLDNVLCLKDSLERTVCMLFYEIYRF